MQVLTSSLRRAALAAAALPAALFAQQVSAADTLRAISLTDAVAMARENAPAAVQARGQLRTSASSVRSAYAALLPSLSVSLNQSKQGGQRFDNTGKLVPYTAAPWSYSTGLSSSINLFDGGRRFADIKARKADVLTAEANQTAQSFNIALQVKTQYAAILAARESEAAARAQLSQANAQLTYASARVKAGAATVSDSLRSVIQVGNAQLALLTAQNSLRVASAALSRLVGSEKTVTALASDTLDLHATPIDSSSLLMLAEHGPAVEQATSALRSSRAAYKSSKTGYLPSVDLRFNRAGSGFDQGYGLGGGQLAYGNTWSLGLSYPLFNNLTREDAVVRADVAQDNAEAALRDARLLARQNLVSQFAALRTAEERIKIQLASVAAAQEDLRVQQQRYTLGASTLLDLLTSQSTLDAARAALIQARQDYRLARAQIEAIIGRDL